ncbi:MAG: hypothetical protein WCD38_13370 [Candidatus Tumulicola sp.]
MASNGAPAAIDRSRLKPFGGPAMHRTTLGRHPLLQPNPCCTRTLFVSDQQGDEVQLYKFPNGNYLGQLPQPPETFIQPEGECVDATNPQHVFVTNLYSSTIDEYTHSGVYVMHLNDAGENPVSCAYRQTGSTSGVLAVGNLQTASLGGGSISIFTNNAGTWSGPTIYTPSGTSTYYVYFVAYKGTALYIDGLLDATQFFFMKMSQSGMFTPVALFGTSCPCTINLPAGVQQIGNYLAVGDQTPSPGSPNIYHVLPSGQVIGSTILSPSPSELVQFFRQGSDLVGPDYMGANADIYSYPGGSLLTPIAGGVVGPVGSAVSHQ